MWLSNQYTGTGLEFTRPAVTFNATNRIPFVADPHNQPSNVGTAAPNEVNLLDPDYKYPQVLRWNLAYDRTVAGWTTTAEFLHTKTLQDVFYQNLNYAESGQTRPDGRPVMTRVNTTFSNAFFLTNTDQGDQWTASVKGERRMRNGLFASASYLYGRSNTVNDGASSTAFSNWQFLYTRGNSEPSCARDFRPRRASPRQCDGVVSPRPRRRHGADGVVLLQHAVGPPVLHDVFE